MEKTKSKSKDVEEEKSTMIKIAEKVGELAGNIVNQKNQFIAMADDAIESVRTTIHDLTDKKKPVIKNVTKKIIKHAAKKAIPLKPTKIKRAIKVKKQTVKKGINKAAQKSKT